MKKGTEHIILLALIFLNSKMYAQVENLSVFDRHNGIIMQRAISLEFEETTKLFYYNKDDHNKWKHLEVRNYDLFNIKGTDNGKYSISIKFYNPLRIKFTFDETRIADPSIEDINNFINKIPADLYGLNKTFQTLNQNSSNLQNFTFPNTVYSPDWFLGEIQNVNTHLPVSSSIILSQWLYEFNLIAQTEKLNDTNLVAMEVLNVLKKIKASDDYLYNEIDFVEKQDTVRKNLSDWMSDIQKSMYNQVSREDFNKQLERSSAILKRLEKAKAEAEQSISTFFALITEQYTDKIAPLLPNGPQGDRLKKNFKDYCIASRQWISITIAERKQLNDDAIKKLREYIDKLVGFNNQFDAEGYKTLQTSQIDHKEGKIKEITIAAVKLEIDGKEVSDTKKTNMFRIGRWNSAYPYLSTGGFFTNFSFPEYNLGIDSSGASVINSSAKKIRFSPAIFLNFVFSLHNDYIYPVFQIGLGTADKSILLPVGVGISIMDRITISGGIVPGFARQLNELKPGDRISGQTALDQDLSYKLMSTTYFGVNINLNK